MKTVSTNPDLEKVKKSDGYYFYKHYYMTDEIIKETNFFF